GDIDLSKHYHGEMEHHVDQNHQHHEHDGHADHEAHKHHEHDHNHDHGGHGHGGHDHHHHGYFEQIFKRSLWIGIPILLLSPLMGFTETGLISFPYSDIVVAVLATILLFYGGKPFFHGGWHEVKAGEPSMMALVAFDVGVSYIY